MKNDINIDEYKSAVEVLNQIKEKCKASTSASEKIVLLTLAPKTWGRKRLAAEFNVSERQARNAIQLVKEHGILTSPMPKKGLLLSAEVKNLVVNFYSDDENSRMPPGKKHYVSVKKEDGSREHQQKRLVLCNLSELYSNFRQQNQGVKIGFSKFSQLRPRNCVLAGSSGTHTVCVCVHHENVKKFLETLLNAVIFCKYMMYCCLKISRRVKICTCLLKNNDVASILSAFYFLPCNLQVLARSASAAATRRVSKRTFNCCKSLFNN